jgi:hypothetical protein
MIYNPSVEAASGHKAGACGAEVIQWIACLEYISSLPAKVLVISNAESLKEINSGRTTRWAFYTWFIVHHQDFS